MAMDDEHEGYGGAVVVAYVMMVLWGIVLGLGIGWLVWG